MARQVITSTLASAIAGMMTVSFLAYPVSFLDSSYVAGAGT